MKEATQILMVTAGFPPMIGGISTHSYLLAKNIGQKIAVLAPSCGGIEKFDKKESFQIIRMKLVNMHISYKPGKNFLLFNICLLTAMMFYILRYTIKLKPRKFYFSHWVYVIPGLLSSKIFKIPYYFAAHGTEVVKPMENVFYKTLLRACIKNASKIICLGSFQKRNLLKEGVPYSKLYAVHEGVDLESFNPNISALEITEKYGLKDKKVILTVGRLVKRKGHDMVIKSLSTILKRVPNAVYIIVGGGPELENLRNLVKRLDLEKNVIFTGYVSNKDLPKYYNVCDTSIMASREVNGDIEGFGIVYLEANACGKPAIAGRSGGTESAVRHGVNGFLVDPLSTEDISEKITLLLTNKKLAEKMGRKGRILAEKKFNYALVAKKILNVIENT